MNPTLLFIVMTATSVLATAVAVAADETPGGKLPIREWQIGGVARKAMVRVPQSAATQPAPVVFGFHGRGGDIDRSIQLFQVEKLWPEAIVVYMQGLPTPGELRDREGKKNAWQRWPGDQEDRDLKFFDEILATLKKENKVDPDRIYATGNSAGGFFVFLLWGARGDVFAALAPTSSYMHRNPTNTLKVPKPLMKISGEKDQTVPFKDQQEMTKILRKLNGCENAVAAESKSGDLSISKYQSGSGPPVYDVTHPGGHGFAPGAAELIIDFFKQHRRE